MVSKFNNNYEKSKFKKSNDFESVSSHEEHDEVSSTEEDIKFHLKNRQSLKAIPLKIRHIKTEINAMKD